MGVLGGAMAIAYAAKLSVDEHRPPHRLWVIPPDNAHSFPSGHTAIAAGLSVAVVLLVPAHRRLLAAAAGAAFTAVVAAARVYLGVHYPPDVLGGVLCAASAALLTCGVLQTPAVRRRVEALEEPAARARHARRSPAPPRLPTGGPR
nr:phosphatase PAP2 family protein [Streptomyces boncukensis]